MSMKKIMGILAMLAITTLLALTSCDDGNGDPVGTDTTGTGGSAPAAVTGLCAGATSETSIQVKWDAEKTATSYIVSVANATGTVVSGDTVKVGETYYNLTNAAVGTEYTFSVRAYNAHGTSNSATIKWATSYKYTKNDNDANIYVYGSNSSSYGSGLEIHNADGNAPKTWKMANAANWNLGLYTKDGKVIFGSAAALGYTGTFTNSASITSILTQKDGSAFNAKDLNELLLSNDLSTMSYSSSYIDLTSSHATAVADGIAIFAKTHDNHYAKIVILRNGDNGGYLHNAGTNDEYIHCLVSWQPTAGLPYAKH